MILPRLRCILQHSWQREAAGEAGRVGAKLQNLLSLEKPGKEVEVIVISDGSSDATVEILQQFEGRGLIKAMVHAEPRGKAACISDALNCLKAADVDTLGDLVSYNKADLLKFRNFGKKSLTELEELVRSKNLTFGMNISKYKLEKS